MDGRCPPGSQFAIEHTCNRSNEFHYLCMIGAHAFYCAECVEHASCMAGQYCARKIGKRSDSEQLCLSSTLCIEDENAVDGRCPSGTIDACCPNTYLISSFSRLPLPAECANHSCLTDSRTNSRYDSYYGLPVFQDKYCAKRANKHGKEFELCRPTSECFDKNDAVRGKCPNGLWHLQLTVALISPSPSLLSLSLSLFLSQS